MHQSATIYYTSDTHGGLFPSNHGSLVQCISAFEKDGNTLILDGGDTLQGAPLLRYLWEKDAFASNIPWFFNRGGYDYYTLGNHDFNYGYDGLRQFVQAMDSQCIVANVTDTSGALDFAPYAIHTLGNGLRLGITGVVTSWVTVWEGAENLQNLAIGDAFLAAQGALNAMKPHCDVTICIYHGGYEEDLDTGAVLKTTDENIACKLARELSFDLLLTGHQHAKHENRTLWGTHTLQPPANGAQYAKITIEKTDQGVTITSGLHTPGHAVRPELAERAAALKTESDVWLNKPMGTLTQAVPVLEKIQQALEGSPIADLNNAVQLEATGAEISCTSLHNAPVQLPQVVTVGDVLRVAPYPNEIVVKALTGWMLLRGLERSASYFAQEQGQLVVAKRFLFPKEEHYNYDYFANVTYTVDMNQGNRVIDVMVNGEPLDLQRTYTVAMSDYRATGAGGYDAYVEAPVVMTHSDTMQQLLLDYVEKHPNLQIKPMSSVSILR